MEVLQTSLGLISKGGIIIIPILLCSIIAVAIIIERLVYFYNLKENAELLYAKATEAVKKRNVANALELCRQSRGPVGKILATGLVNKDAPKWKLEETLSVTGQEIMHNLEKNIKGLEVIAAISPLMGLLGTVIGMVQAFNQVAEYKGQVNPSLLAGGIWEALLTTAAGLAVAIPVLVMMHYFDKRIEKMGFMMEKFSHFFVHYVEENRAS